MKKLLLLPLLWWWLGVAHAGSPVFKLSVEAPLPKVYQALYEALEAQRLWVVFEADIGANLARMADRLGDDYNRSGLSGLRSLVVCNAGYANRVSNADPDMLALCPLRVAVVEKDGTTSMLFARPSVMAQGSPALPVVQEVEDRLIEALRSAGRQALAADSAGAAQ